MPSNPSLKDWKRGGNAIENGVVHATWRRDRETVAFLCEEGTHGPRFRSWATGPMPTRAAVTCELCLRLQHTKE